MCSGSMDDVDKTEHFLPETNNHPTLSIPHSGFCPLNGASIGPSLAALPFSAEAAFPYIVCNISYFLLSCKIRLLHIGWKKKKVVNFCTTFKMNLQIMKKWVSPIRTHPWRKRWDSNPRALADNLISSQSRYDHFDTAPYLSQHQHFGKRGELMGRTSKNIKLRIPEKPHKIKGFRSGSYRVATTISSQARYDHFDTLPYRIFNLCNPVT